MSISIDPWSGGGRPYLNLASVSIVTGILGPETRAVVAAQGCDQRCSGCLAPEWQGRVTGALVTPAALADELLADERVTGLTFTGGEPMLQAAGFAELARVVRARRNVTVICFTGYTLQRLLTAPPGPGVVELLNQVDVLIDGPYIESLNDNQGMRGSSNQRVLYLTNRIPPDAFDFIRRRRDARIQVADGYVRFIGVPPRGLTEALGEALATIQAGRGKGDDANEHG